MERLNEEEKKTLRAKVYDMTETQKLFCLFTLINGADLVYAIEEAASHLTNRISKTH